MRSYWYSYYTSLIIRAGEFLGCHYMSQLSSPGSDRNKQKAKTVPNKSMVKRSLRRTRLPRRLRTTAWPHDRASSAKMISIAHALWNDIMKVMEIGTGSLQIINDQEVCKSVGLPVVWIFKESAKQAFITYSNAPISGHVTPQTQ